MSSRVAIRVENLSKAYRIGLKEQRHETLIGSMSAMVRAPFQNFRSVRKLSNFEAPGQDSQPLTSNSRPSDVIWALENVSFEIKHGEVVGIIGRNGAGKSTLLKILSRITEPTSGRVEIFGRVASLLEVGTGFHPDLTGRENVYLNGTILGMRKQEIDAKFDEIVDFSGIEKFIDTPVKRYSSGMRVRLAFSVAASLEPEILIIDEVLAVGDAEFQKKCLWKMGEVAAAGRTVLFVSHNLGAVRQLCQSSLLLQQGKLEFRGSVVDGLTCYSKQITNLESSPSIRGTVWGPIMIHGDGHGVATSVEGSRPLQFECDLEIAIPITEGYVFCIINDSMGDTLLHKRVKLSELNSEALTSGRHRLCIELPIMWLAPGMYAVSFKLVAETLGGSGVRCVSDTAMLDVTSSTNTDSLGKNRVVLNPPAQWSVTSVAEVLPA